MVAEAGSSLVHVIVTLGILLFAAKLFATLFHRMKQPPVLGEIIAGIVMGPFAFGGLFLINGEPVVVLDITVINIGEIAAIVILFVAGMQTTPKEFFKLGVPSFTVGALGVIVPFFLGYFIFVAIGIDVLASIIIATALTATSIAISIQVLIQLGRLQSKEGKLILGAAVADDVLGIAILSVVLSMIHAGDVNFAPSEAIFLLLKILGIYGVLLVAAILVIPRLLNIETLWRSHGGVEAAATAVCFAFSGAASLTGLSPIVGAFAAGMAVTASKTFDQIKAYAEKLDIVFAPLFFAIIGARVDLRGVNLDVLLLGGLLIAIAVASKIVGCGLPSMLFLKDARKATKVGIGMVSRGEVGLIVAAAGTSAGVLSGNLYTTVILMVAITTIITPLWLKIAYKKDRPEPSTAAMGTETQKSNS